MCWLFNKPRLHLQNVTSDNLTQALNILTLQINRRGQQKIIEATWPMMAVFNECLECQLVDMFVLWVDESQQHKRMSVGYRRQPRWKQSCQIQTVNISTDIQKQFRLVEQGKIYKVQQRRKIAELIKITITTEFLYFSASYNTGWQQLTTKT